MINQLTITTHAPNLTKSLVQHAIQRELKTIQLGIRHTEKQLSQSEHRFAMSTSEFIRRFNQHELGESLDLIDWWMESLALERLQENYRVLNEAQVD